MSFCWAKNHSECKGKISREHLVSSGVFEQKNIYVQGFDWCNDEKKVSVASITSKILCEKHNNGMSDIDQAGIDAIKTIESVLPPNARSVDTLTAKKYINGHDFERWLLKTAINVSVKSENHIGVGMANSQVGLPSAYLLAVIFGELKLTNEMGLYFLFPKGEYKFKVGSFHMYPVVKDKEIGAFVFHIRGLDFLLNLLPGYPPPSLKNLGISKSTGNHDYMLDSVPQYRSNSIIIGNANENKQSVHFYWA